MLPEFIVLGQPLTSEVRSVTKKLPKCFKLMCFGKLEESSIL